MAGKSTHIDKARRADTTRKDPWRAVYLKPEAVQHGIIMSILKEAELVTKNPRKKASANIFVSLWPSGENHKVLDAELRIKETFLKDLERRGQIAELSVYIQSVKDETGPYETDAFFASFDYVPIKLLGELRKIKETTEKRMLENDYGLSAIGLMLDAEHIYYRDEEANLGGGLQQMFLVLAKSLLPTTDGFKGSSVKLSELQKVGGYTPDTIRANLTKLRRALSSLNGLTITVSGDKKKGQYMEILTLKRHDSSRNS